MKIVRSDTASLREPAGPVTVASGAEAYTAGTGQIGVLLCHGFTGSPRSMRPWAEHLVGEGFRVRLPRLPGHGTSWEELNSTEWTDWYAVVERELLLLRRECDTVFIAGLSMGGCLALRLAENHGSAIGGLAIVNPVVRLSDPRMVALPLLRRLRPSLKSIANDIAMPHITEGGYERTPLHALSSMTKLWLDVRTNLHKVNQPLLLLRSRQDHVVDPSSAELILSSVRSADVTEVVLERSYHVATLDYDADQIFTSSAAFFRRLGGS